MLSVEEWQIYFGVLYPLEEGKSPARIDRDADGLSHLLADAGGLELLEGEAAAQTLLQVVLERRTSDHRAERLDRPRGNLR